LKNGGHPLVDNLHRINTLGMEYDLPVRDFRQIGWIKAVSYYLVKSKLSRLKS
jgi:hypothetical protein